MSAAAQVPWSDEAEQSILGGLLLDNGAAWRVGDLKAEHFHNGDHRAIFAAIMGEIASKRAADPVTLHAALGAHADGALGLPYLNALAQSVPSSSNVGRYAEIVIDRAMRRALLAAAEEAMAAARDVEKPAADQLDHINGLFLRLRQRGSRSEPRSLSELMSECIDRWEAQAAGTVAAESIPTKLPSLDHLLGGGLYVGELSVLAARPSVGKSSLAGQLALTCAAAGHEVLLLSQEMRAVSLARRAAANLGGLRLSDLRGGRIKAEDWSRVSDVAERVLRMPLHIDDQAGLTLAAINAKARRHQQQHGLKLLILDYLQLCSGTVPRETRNLQVEEISRGLKVLAKDLNIVVLALSQLNRQSTQRNEPDLADLRDSGAIEQDADAVIFLHPKSQLPDGSFLIAAIVAKQREGRRGRVALSFRGETQQWVESTADVSPERGAR